MRTVVLALLGAAWLCSPLKGATAPELSDLSVVKYRHKVEADGSVTRFATVNAPQGTRRVILQSKTADGWTTRSVAHTDGTASVVKFRIPVTVKRRELRVLGSEQDLLPASCFKGSKKFSIRSNGSTSTIGTGSGPSLNLSPSSDGGKQSTSGISTGSTSSVVEADVWKILGSNIYFFNQYRGLQVIDISNPDAPAITARLRLPAVGEDLYLIDASHVVLLAHKGNVWNESEVIAVKVDGNNATITSRITIPGWIDSSRMVGSHLYVATNGWIPTTNSNSSSWGTTISHLDLSDPENPQALETKTINGYGNLVFATDSYFVVGTSSSDWRKTTLNLYGIDPTTGVLQGAGTATPAGQVNSKFNLQISGTVLAAFSHTWGNGSQQASSQLETFALDGNSNPKLGTETFADGEQLFGTRFDGSLAYAVTYRTIDPLWVIDISNPAQPTITGTLETPGYSTYLQPLNGQLLALGLENGKIAVSLYDVSNPSQPALSSRLLLGDTYAWSEALFDDHAFTVLPGWALLPLSSYDPETGTASEVQLVQISGTTLVERGVIAQDFQPRRATMLGDRIFSISGRQLLTVDAADPDQPETTSDVALSWPVDRIFKSGNYLVEIENGSSWNSDGPFIRIAPASDPDYTLNEVALGGDPISGAAIHNGALLTVQSTRSSYHPIYYTTASTVSPAPSTDNRVKLTFARFDLGALPDVAVSGSTEVKTDPFNYFSEFKALFPASDLAVWSVTEGSNWWYGGPVMMASSSDTAIAKTPIMRPWWGPTETGLRFFAVDLSGSAAPELQSETEVATDASSVGNAFAGDGVVLASHAGSWKNRDRWDWVDDESDEPVTDEGWNEGWRLDVVDFSNPKKPVVLPSVDLPNELIGVVNASPSSALLISSGDHLRDSKADKVYLDASVYDGATVTLLDSIKLSNPVTTAAVSGSTALVASAADNSYSSGLVQFWTLTNSGTFAAGTTVASDEVPWSAGFVNDLAVLSTSDSIETLDVRDPSNVTPVGSTDLNYWFSAKFDAAAGNVTDGLWLPVGVYGVEVVAP